MEKWPELLDKDDLQAAGDRHPTTPPVRFAFSGPRIALEFESLPEARPWYDPSSVARTPRDGGTLPEESPISEPVSVARTYTSRIEAEIARGLLETSGIDAVLSADDCSSWHPEFHVAVGIRLLVPERQRAEAIRILDAGRGDAGSDDETMHSRPTTRSDSDDGTAAAEEVRRDLALGGALESLPGGSVPVFAAGSEHVIKLFPCEEESFFQTERAALRFLDGALSVPTPRLVAAGDRRGWWFMVMTRLPGRSLADAWPDIDLSGRHELMRRLGVTLAELHSLVPEGLAPLAVDWGRFLEGQRASCRERQRAHGLGPPWLDAIEGFLSRWTPPDDGRRVLLHTEVMREHLLVEQRGRTWHLSGLLDFEPAMIGAPEYELASVGVFVTSAEPGMLHTLLEAYGAGIDNALPFRILAYVLLHRYSNLPWYLERLPAPDEPGNLEGLALRWFTP